MAAKALADVLRRFTVAAGVPGAEGTGREIVRACLAGVGDISYDGLGSSVCERAASRPGPRVVLDAHMDEVAFMVQSLSDEGKLSLVPLGGWWGHVLLGQRVDVVLESGTVPGVIGCKPPHFLQAAERDRVVRIDDMYVDVGASSREDVDRLGIRVGDPVVPHAEFVELDVPGVLSSKAFDNRVGVGLLCEVMGALAGSGHPNTVIGVGAVQEEVGCRGAETASTVARPDVAVVLEGTPADDLPGLGSRQAALGEGPQIRFYDPAAISNRRLVRLSEEVATELKVPVQVAVRRSGATDARSISRYGRGVPTVVVGVPARYIHTHTSLIQWDDYVAARRLALELVRRLDGKTVESLCDWGK